jgi:hypothetical protein
MHHEVVTHVQYPRGTDRKPKLARRIDGHIGARHK